MEFINEGCVVVAVSPAGTYRTPWATAENELLAEIIAVSLQERFDRISGKV